MMILRLWKILCSTEGFPAGDGRARADRFKANQNRVLIADEAGSKR